MPSRRHGCWSSSRSPALSTAQDEDIAQSHQMLAAYERRIALRPVIEARLADMKHRANANVGVIMGTSAELAAANIQNVVKALIESDSGQVRSTQNLPPVTADGFQRVDVQYEASIPMTRLKDVAYRIETATPYLFLDGVDLRAPESWQIGPYVPDAPNVEVRWTVHGYRWAGTP
ncbi:MAG: type II secretion system protein GspM [Rhizomicrobium sp.]